MTSDIDAMMEEFMAESEDDKVIVDTVEIKDDSNDEPETVDDNERAGSENRSDDNIGGGLGSDKLDSTETEVGVQDIESNDGADSSIDSAEVGEVEKETGNAVTIEEESDSEGDEESDISEVEENSNNGEVVIKSFERPRLLSGLKECKRIKLADGSSRDMDPDVRHGDDFGEALMFYGKMPFVAGGMNINAFGNIAMCKDDKLGFFYIVRSKFSFSAGIPIKRSEYIDKWFASLEG